MKKIFLMLFCSVTLFSQTGVVKSRYLNGETQSVVSYSDGIYDGTSYWYYDNGNLKEEKTYSNGKLNGWVRTYYETGLLKEEYFVDNGVIDGGKKSYYDNGALAYIKTYDGGVLKSTKEFGYDPRYEAPIEAYYAGTKQSKIKQKANEELICDSEICPSPIGGMNSIYKKITYPPDAKAYGLEGKVLVSATIDEKGGVVDAKVVKGIGLGCDEEAQKAVMNTKFLPGQNNGGVVVSHITVTVKFDLDSQNQIAMNTADSQINQPASGPKTIDPGTSAQQSVSDGNPGGNNITEEKDYVDAPVKTPAYMDTENKVVVKEKEMVSEPKKTPEYSGTSTVKAAAPAAKTTTPSIPKNNFECDYLVDQCAKPSRGIMAILDNLVIPSRVKAKNIKGEVVVEADVNERGRVTNTNVLQGLPEGCSIAVEVAILDTKFEPATKNGKAVPSKVKITVPIEY